MSLLFALLAASASAATITVDAAGGADHTSLSSAISAASSGDTITIAAGTYTGPFDTAGKDLTLSGAGLASTVLTAGPAQTVLTVDDGEAVVVYGLTLDGALQGLEVRSSTVSMTSVHVTDHTGRTPGSGAGVYDGGSLTITGCVFARNEASASYSGGGVYVSDSTFTATNATFRDNAAGQGGALYIDNSVATLTDVTLDSNIAASHGGGIRVRYDASLTATRLTATDNTAASRGGAISGYQADVRIIDGTFTGNAAGTAGGALHLDQTSSTSVSVTAEISGNTAGSTGGGIHADTLSLGFSGTLTQNTAGDDSDGGGLYAIAADVSLDTVELTGNQAGNGGGIYSFYGGSLDLELVTLSGNTALIDGGAIYSESPVVLVSSTLSGNSAVGDGGGLAILDSTASLDDVEVIGNEAGGAGGGLYANDSDLTLAGNVEVSDCTAVYGAGIAVAGSGAETVDLDGGPHIHDNTASGEGGGIFLSNVLEAILDGSNITGNDGGVAGGGARLADISHLSAVNLAVTSNVAEHGGGLHMSGIGSGETAYSMLSGNTASNAGGGILVQNPAAFHPFHHLQFIENAAPEGAGFYLFNDVASLHPLAFSDVVANTGPGVSLRQAPGSVVSHVASTHNSAEGFESDATSAATAQLEYCLAWDNGASFGGALPALEGVDGNLVGDPDYAGVTPDSNPGNELLVPGSNSELRDNGDPALRDLDGTITDIGHLAGPDAVDQDFDEDGVAISGGDCDDANADTYPGAAEVWYNGEDNDCLGGDDYDADSDGYTAGEDCDDTSASINPGEADTSTDGIDQDCDGVDGVGGGGDGSGSGTGSEDEDLDADGYPQSEDCDDSNPSAFPGNIETCGDAVDNDCDGFVDDYDNDCVGKAGDRACSSSGTGPVGWLALAGICVGMLRRRAGPTA